MTTLILACQCISLTLTICDTTPTPWNQNLIWQFYTRVKELISWTWTRKAPVTQLHGKYRDEAKWMENWQKKMKRELTMHWHQEHVTTHRNIDSFFFFVNKLQNTHVPAQSFPMYSLIGGVTRTQGCNPHHGPFGGKHVNMYTHVDTIRLIYFDTLYPQRLHEATRRKPFQF